MLPVLLATHENPHTVDHTRYASTSPASKEGDTGVVSHGDHDHTSLWGLRAGVRDTKLAGSATG